VPGWLRKAIWETCHQIIPHSWGGAPSPRVEDQTLQWRENAAKIADAAKWSRDDTIIKELRDYAKSRVDEEVARHTSIISRAQGLLGSLALAGSVQAFVVTLATTSVHFERWHLYSCGILVAYVLLQMLVTFQNIRKAVGPLTYLKAGASDLIKWLGLRSVNSLYRSQFNNFTDQYRSDTIVNNWRFDKLNDALFGLRNIILCMGLLSIFLLIFTMVVPLTSAVPTSQCNCGVPQAPGHAAPLSEPNSTIPTPNSIHDAPPPNPPKPDQPSTASETSSPSASTSAPQLPSISHSTPSRVPEAKKRHRPSNGCPRLPSGKS